MRGFSRKQNNFFIFAQVAAQELLKTKNTEGKRHAGPNIKVDVVGERSVSFCPDPLVCVTFFLLQLVCLVWASSPEGVFPIQAGSCRDDN